MLAIADQPPRQRLLHGLQSCSQRRTFRLADEQMHVLGHDDVAAHPKNVLAAGLLQRALHQTLVLRAHQQGFAVVASEGDEMQIAGLLVSPESPWHESRVAASVAMSL